VSLRINSDFNGVTDPDAGAYIAAVEAADGQLLEFAVGKAINDFVVGCKADGTWNAIKASCILAGARTLSGALVPLVGAAPTNINFASGNYDRKIGISAVVNASIGSNRSATADPQNNNHISIYLASPLQSTGSARLIGGSFGGGTGFTSIEKNTSNINFHTRNNTAVATTTANGKMGLLGLSRLSTSVVVRFSNTSSNYTQSSNTPTPGNIAVISQVDSIAYSYSSAFYSIGEALDLALLDTRVTTLINAFAAAIP